MSPPGEPSVAAKRSRSFPGLLTAPPFLGTPVDELSPALLGAGTSCTISFEGKTGVTVVCCCNLKIPWLRKAGLDAIWVLFDIPIP